MTRNRKCGELDELFEAARAVANAVAPGGYTRLTVGASIPRSRRGGTEWLALVIPAGPTPTGDPPALLARLAGCVRRLLARYPAGTRASLHLYLSEAQPNPVTMYGHLHPFAELPAVEDNRPGPPPKRKAVRR